MAFSNILSNPVLIMRSDVHLDFLHDNSYTKMMK